jgi:hypothetical protein
MPEAAVISQTLGPRAPMALRRTDSRSRMNPCRHAAIRDVTSVGAAGSARLEVGFSLLEERLSPLARLARAEGQRLPERLHLDGLTE